MQRNWGKNWQDRLCVNFSAESANKDEMKQTLLQDVLRQATVMCQCVIDMVYLESTE